MTTDVSFVFRNYSDMDKSCVVFMKRSQECECVILETPLQIKEGFFVLTHTASFHNVQCSFSLSKMITSLTSI